MSVKQNTAPSNLRLKVMIGLAILLIVPAFGYRFIYDKLNPGQLQVGSIAPDFTTHTVDGKELTLSQLRGKVVLIDFWATWCQPCAMATPVLESLHKKYHDQGLEVIGISTDSPETAVNVPSFMSQTGITYTISSDPEANARIANTYRADSLPTQYVIDRDGRIQWSQQGYSLDEQTQLPPVIEKLLAQR